MPGSKNSKTHNIFMIDISRIQKAYFENKHVPCSAIINKIMCLAEPNYTEQELLDNLALGEFDIRFYFHWEQIQKDSKLASFCRPFVRENQEVFNVRPCNVSSVLFVWNDTRLFAITTGQGFRAVESFCYPKFGLLIVSAFEEIFKVTGLDSNGMSSIIHSTRTIYSNEVDFINVEALDTVYKEVSGRLNDKQIVKQLLALDDKSKKQSMKVIAKNSIQFSSSLDFQKLLHLLRQICQFDLENLQDRFNLISPISAKKHADVIKENNSIVIQSLYHSIEQNKPLEFDLFHHDTNSFINADRYILSINRKDSLAEVDEINPEEFISCAYNKFLNGSDPSIESFSDFVQSVHLTACKGDFLETDDKLLKHISGEINSNGKSYYIFYGEYYYLNEAYSERLNHSLKGKLTKERFSTAVHTPWDTGDNEDDFNLNVSVKEGYALLHRQLIDYIEFADLLRQEPNGEITVVHVKNGFDNDMRALDRQVELSITRILDLKNNNNENYMRLLYRKAASKPKGTSINSLFITEDIFINALKENTVRYLIVIHPPKKELIENDSNIAKHCLNALILRCFNQGIDLKIAIV